MEAELPNVGDTYRWHHEDRTVTIIGWSLNGTVQFRIDFDDAEAGDEPGIGACPATDFLLLVAHRRLVKQPNPQARFEHETRHIREWVCGDGSPTHPLVRELARALVRQCDSTADVLERVVEAIREEEASSV